MDLHDFVLDALARAKIDDAHREADVLRVQVSARQSRPTRLDLLLSRFGSRLCRAGACPTPAQEVAAGDKPPPYGKLAS